MPLQLYLLSASPSSFSVVLLPMLLFSPFLLVHYLVSFIVVFVTLFILPCHASLFSFSTGTIGVIQISKEHFYRVASTYLFLTMYNLCCYFHASFYICFFFGSSLKSHFFCIPIRCFAVHPVKQLFIFLINWHFSLSPFPETVLVVQLGPLNGWQLSSINI